MSDDGWAHDARAAVEDRLTEASFDTPFIDCVNGGKASHDHTHLPFEATDGNYGIHATAADSLVLVDIDDAEAYASAHTDGRGFDRLPDTFEQSSPHAHAECEGHRIYAVTTEGEATITERINETFGADNPQPSTGEIRTANQYVVGAGSQLTGCDKEWCDECATPEGGRYVVAHNRAIATVDADTFIDVLADDPALDPTAGGGDDDTEELTLDDIEAASEAAAAGDWTNEQGHPLSRFRGDEKLDDLLTRVQPSGYGYDDTSGPDHAAIEKLHYYRFDLPTTVDIFRAHREQGREKFEGRSVAEYVARSYRKFDNDDRIPLDGSSGQPADAETDYRHPTADDGWDDLRERPATDKTGARIPAADAEVAAADGLYLENGRYGTWSEVTRQENGEMIRVGWDFTPKTNFRMVTESFLIDGDDKSAVVTVIPAENEAPYEVHVPMTHFNDFRKFADAVATGRTTVVEGGGGALDDLRLLVGRQDAPTRTAVNHMGLHETEIVVPGGVLTADGWTDDPEHVYVEQNIGTETKWALTPDDGLEYDAGDVAAMLELVPRTRPNEEILPTMGWFYAATVRPLIQTWEGQLNHLHVSGDTGAGKTSTLEVLWQMFGMDGDPMSVGDTKFTLTATMASTCSVPLWYDEYKPGNMATYEVDRFHELFRKATRGGVEFRGNADKSMEEYHLRAPLAVSGEEMVQGAAENRRVLPVRYTDGVKQPGSDTAVAFNRLTGRTAVANGETVQYAGYDPTDHARAYYSWLLDVLTDDDRDLRAVWTAAAEHVSAALDGHTEPDDLRRQGLQMVQFGYTLYRMFADAVETEAGVPIDTPPQAAVDDALRVAAGGVEEGRASHLEEFMGLLADAAASQYLEYGDEYRRVHAGEASEELAIDLDRAFAKVSKYVRDHDLDGVDLLSTPNDYKKRFKEDADGGGYTITHSKNTRPFNRAVRVSMGDLVAETDVNPAAFRDKSGDEGAVRDPQSYYEFEEAAGVPDDAEGTAADARRLRELIAAMGGEMSYSELRAKAGTQCDIAPDDVDAAVEKALANGTLYEPESDRIAAA